MPIRPRLIPFAIAAVLVGVLTIGAVWPRPQVYTRAYDHVLGTSMELRLQASSAQAADRAAEAVLAEIDREASLLSGYDPTSEFSRWMSTRNSAVPVSPELFDVLQQFDVWRARTNGALDASAETVSRVWKAAATEGHVPTATALHNAVAAVQQRHWSLDPVTRTATHLSDAPLVLNSFTKSFIVDRAASAALGVPGVSSVVVNIGGDLVTRGSLTETVDITDPAASADNAPPLTRLAVSDRAVATSGVYRRGFDIDGVHYSHIVDPRTGHPTSHVLSATVVAKDAADAGALATAMCVLTPEESEQLATLVPSAEFMLVLADGRRLESRGWNALTAPRPRKGLTVQSVATLHAAEQAMWKSDFELTISLTIAPQQFRAQRPYVAVWIEDKDRVPVRTLAVWYRANHARWLPDLRAWYRGDRQRTQTEGTEIINSVSSATRGPGAYTLTWDGKNNTGELVKAGTYTVNIEAVREHGTYQIMRQAMDFTGTAAKVDIAPNAEISAASLSYHRVAGK